MKIPAVRIRTLLHQTIAEKCILNLGSAAAASVSAATAKGTPGKRRRMGVSDCMLLNASDVFFVLGLVFCPVYSGRQDPGDVHPASPFFEHAEPCRALSSLSDPGFPCEEAPKLPVLGHNLLGKALFNRLPTLANPSWQRPCLVMPAA